MLELRALLIDEGTPKRAAEAVARGLACAAGLAPKTPGGKKYVDPYAIEKLTRLVWEFAYGKPDQPVTVSKKFEKMSDAEVLAELLKAAPPEARAAALAGVEVPQAVPASTPTPSSAALPGEPGRRIEGA